MGPGPAKITQLLAEWRQGDEAAFEQLAPAVYDRLHAIAESYLRGERPTHTLQATALVNELFLRLVKNSGMRYDSREHFYSFAAKLMRRILVDYARKDGAKKRGERAEPVLLAPELAWVDAASAELLDLDHALTELAELDPAKVRTLELRFFLGATSVETAELLGQSRARVDRDVNFALSWLHQRLQGGEQNSAGSRHPE
ncbi:MAG TPA: ECF-type sigma factor [Bryobacteraceae bacterium]|jgi:RNA polymerase sigma factor (TIGR02999 family)|nr:ECF-type sigma factor [Bryobacteraceae bacterium]